MLQKGKFLISGGRDRTLRCWELGEGSILSLQHEMHEMSHAGWIWGLTSVDDKTFYSCSWDRTVKLWHIDHLQLVEVRKFKMYIQSSLLFHLISNFPQSLRKTCELRNRSMNDTQSCSIFCSREVMGALLCITSHPGVNLLAAGSQCRTVILFDPRVSAVQTRRYRAHRGAVLRLAMNDNYILSASEDRTVNVWDQRAAKILTTIEVIDYLTRKRSKRYFPRFSIFSVCWPGIRSYEDVCLQN